MNRLIAKRLTAVVMLTALLLPLTPRPARADDSDIFGSNVEPNVVILLDNSLSMNISVPGSPYVPGTSYGIRQKCDPVSGVFSDCLTAKVYKAGLFGVFTTYAANIAAVPDASAQSSLSSNGFWQGTISGSRVTLYVGNYINFVNPIDPAAAGFEPKMTIAHRVINSLLTNTRGVRFGVMTFYYQNHTAGDTALGHRGARMVAPIGTDLATMTAAVNAVVADFDTPLGDALYDAGQYFKGGTLTNGTSFTSPIQLTCQPNFIILVTDGQQTSGNRLMADEATRRFTEDHATGSSFPGTQNVIVHTVGFGVLPGVAGENPIQAQLDLQTAARNGGGQYYRADSATDLERSLQDAIRRIAQATFTFATPVIPTTSTSGSDRAYLAAFKSDASRPYWRGFLKAFQRDTAGLVPVDTNGVPCGPDDQGNLGPGCTASAQVWESGDILSRTAASSRTIYTVLPVTGSGQTRQSFDRSNSNITTTVLNVADSTARNNVIDFIRGIDAFDENTNGNTTEERAWKLGDIFHSTPVLVTKPVLGLADPTYQAFKVAKENRTPVLITGSNDGMLHAFKDGRSGDSGVGSELWAFIPPDLLANLQSLTGRTGEHGFFVDSSPIAVDIKMASDGNWHTIVVFGLRRGGPTYYALDITDTTNPQWLWSYTDTEMGETWSEPAIGKVRLNCARQGDSAPPCVDKFVMFIGGGYDTPRNNAHGRQFVAIDLETGTRLWSYSNDGTSDDRRYMNFSLAANPTAVDLDNNGLIDHVYIADVGGQVWKFDVSNTTGTAASPGWTGKRLFVADNSQPNPPASGEYYPSQGFYNAPALSFDRQGNLWVFIGSGDRNHPNNAASNRLYGFKDASPTSMTQGSPVLESSLTDVTTSGSPSASGWFVTLASTEKVLAAANVFNGIVFFTSFTPTTNAACTGGGGDAKLYALQMNTGLAGINFATGAALSTTDASVARSRNIGQGIASMPVIVITPPANPGTAGAVASTSVITATSNQQVPSNPAPAPGFLKQIRSWAEIIR